MSVTFQVRGDDRRPADGGDVAILPVPDFLADEATGALNARIAGAFLRTLSHQQATDLGRILHHAEWEFSQDPEFIRTSALAHDCEECRAGAARALAWLTANPGQDMLVGRLWWRQRLPADARDQEP